jgi:hypothetical protein
LGVVAGDGVKKKKTIKQHLLIGKKKKTIKQYLLIGKKKKKTIKQNILR